MFEAFVITLLQAASFLSPTALPGQHAGYSSAAKPVTTVASSSTAATSTTGTPAPVTGSGGWGHD